MTKQEVKDMIIEQVLFTNDDIDTIFEKTMLVFENEDADMLGQAWTEVMDELPELN